MKKLLLLIILAYCICFTAQSQELNINETIEYINEKLNKGHLKHEWSVTVHGKLIIKRYWYGDLSSTDAMYLKQLDANSVYVSDSDWIRIRCKGEKSCNHVIFIPEGKSYNQQIYFFRTDDDKNTKKQLANAIIHLIELANKESKYKENDPFDY